MQQALVETTSVEMSNLLTKVDSKVELVIMPQVRGVSVKLNYVSGELQDIRQVNGDREKVIWDRNNDAILAELAHDLDVPVVLNIPVSLDDQSIDYKSLNNGTFSVTGCIYIPQSEYITLNNKRNEVGLPMYGSMLEMVNETIFNDPEDAEVIARENMRIIFIDFFAPFKIGSSVGLEPNNWNEAISAFRNLGFNFAPAFYCLNKATAIERYGDKNPYTDQSHGLKFDVDGILIHTDKFGKDQNHVYAHQYDLSKLIKVIIDEVYWLMQSASGRLQPYAYFTPVEIKGVRHSKVSLHDMPWINRHEIRFGDVITITPGQNHTIFINEAIEIDHVDVSKREGLRKYNSETGEFEFDDVEYDQDDESGGVDTLVFVPEPDNCPACLGEVLSFSGEMYCVNQDCPERRRLMIIDMIMSIMGQTNDKYSLTSEDIQKKIDSKDFDLEKPLSTILSQVKSYQRAGQTKGIPLNIFLNALGIRSLSKQMSLAIADTYPNIQAIMYKDPYDLLLSVKGMSLTLAEEINRTLKNEFVLEVIEDLQPYLEDKTRKPEPTAEQEKDKIGRAARLGHFSHRTFEYDGKFIDKERVKRFFVHHLGYNLESTINPFDGKIYRRWYHKNETHDIDFPDYIIIGEHTGDLYQNAISMVDAEGNPKVIEMTEQQVIVMMDNLGFI